MLGDPRDRQAYRIAIASVGLALAVVLAGVCTIVAVHECVPEELWYICGVAGGLLVGTLIPFSLRRSPASAVAAPSPDSTRQPALTPEWVLALLVLAAGVVAVCFGSSVPVRMLGVALGGLFFGLLIPSPGRWDR